VVAEPEVALVVMFHQQEVQQVMVEEQVVEVDQVHQLKKLGLRELQILVVEEEQELREVRQELREEVVLLS
tara:strand:+ start:151 stop:363 length:213 start_codon:yes stop_codon:yes gene_type:complete